MRAAEELSIIKGEKAAASNEQMWELCCRAFLFLFSKNTVEKPGNSSSGKVWGARNGENALRIKTFRVSVCCCCSLSLFALRRINQFYNYIVPKFSTSHGSTSVSPIIARNVWPCVLNRGCAMDVDEYDEADESDDDDDADEVVPIDFLPN